jgi:predicted dehydrogenase
MSSTPETPTVRCGVIGYGGAFNMGRQHLNEMKRAGMTPVAVCEIDAARLDVAKVDFPGIATFSTVDAMLAESDAQVLAIITPHDTHAPLAIQCLKAGRHVICEKPFAIGTDACDLVIDAATATGAIVTTYHNRHWDGWILRAVEKILGPEKVIGDVYKIRLSSGSRGQPRDWWRSDFGKSGGVMYDWGVHLLEYALQLLPGAKLTEVTGFARRGYWASKAPPEQAWTKNPIEDEGRFVARFDTGTWVELTISSLDRNAPNMIEVVGTEGVYAINWAGWELWKQEGGVTTVQSGKHYESQGYKLYENVFAHLTRGEPLVITPQWARRCIHIIDLAMRSAAAGHAVAPKYE